MDEALHVNCPLVGLSVCLSSLSVSYPVSSGSGKDQRLFSGTHKRFSRMDE